MMANVSIDIQRKNYHRAGSSAYSPVIADFHLSLQADEFVCLVGPSGCGKTTLLNIIAGLDNDYQGKIVIIHGHTKPVIGYVFQNPRLLPWRTVRQNIEIALTQDQAPEILDSFLEAMQLTEYQNYFPERLSLGMSRRAAIIRAFAVNPDILLMDEPFVSLDTVAANQARELLIKLWQQRPHTVLFVTHDLREAITLADRIVFLSASPMRIINEVNVSIPRKDRSNEALIEAFRNSLLSNLQS